MQDKGAMGKGRFQFQIRMVLRGNTEAETEERGESHVNMWGKSLPSKLHSECKGPGARMCLAGFKNN